MRKTIPARIFLGLALICLALSSRATVIQELSFEELVAQSTLIFQGRVTRSEVEQVDALVYTRVWFSVEEILAGEIVEEELSLRFVGGTAADRGVEVGGQYIPKLGDRAVYFVRNAYGDLVNPLTGWHQGAFLIETSAEGNDWLDLSERPDLILFNSRADPLVRKMLDLKFPEEQIVARFPEYQRFPLADFKDAVRAMVTE